MLCIDRKGALVVLALSSGLAFAQSTPLATANLDSNEQLEGIPENSASLWAVQDFSDAGLTGFKLGGGVRHIDRIGDGTGNVDRPPEPLNR